jgi:hypothetical protein
LDGTGSLRENIVGVGAYQPNRTHHQHEDDRQHDCVFRNVLTFVRSNRFCEIDHGMSPPFLRIVIISGI